MSDGLHSHRDAGFDTATGSDVPLARGAAPGAHLDLHLEFLLRQAQPRLMRLAHSYGIVGDEADDIVQETQIRAWRRLRQLRSAERFDAWLNTICRNQCRMYLRSREAEHRHTAFPEGRTPHPMTETEWDVLKFAPAADATDAADGVSGFLQNALADDPSGAAERHELAGLVERALSYVPGQARAALELHYLHGWTLAEIAASLHVSIAAQEMRLRRAREHLRQALLGPLHDEAAAFGLVDATQKADEEGGADWQTTRIPCYLCGQRVLEGRFEAGANGRRELRLRCPGCTRQHGIDVVRSKGLAPLNDLRTFRPALTRTMRALQTHGQRALSSGRDICLHCGAEVQREVVTAEAYPDLLPLALGRYWLVARCSRSGCRGLGAWAVAEPALWSTPQARQFMADHPRWVLGPDELQRWQGRPAILLRMADRGSAAQLTIAVDAETLGVLDIVEARA